MKELSHLNKYLYRYKYYLLLGILFTIFTNIFQILPAQIVRYALNLVVENVTLYKLFSDGTLESIMFQHFATGIGIFAGIILLFALIRGGFLFLVRQTLIVMSRLVEYDLKNEIYEHYQTLPLSFYRKNNTGDIMNRISEDVSRVRMYLGPSIMYGLNLIILFVILIPYMFSIDVRLTLYALLPLPVLSFSIYFVNNIINKRSEEIQRSQSALSTFVQEAFSGIRVLKSYVRENDSLESFVEASDDYKVKSLQLTKVNALFFPLIMSMIGLSTILVIYIGGKQVIEGSITYGNIAEFIIYVNMLTWPVTALGWVTSIMQRAAASQQRINEFLQEKNDIVSEQNLQKEITGNITFENVAFTYPESGITAIKDFNIEVNEGDSLAIIGTTGSGKSTIANLLTRMFDVSKGQILIDGTPLKEFDPAWLRSQMGYVPQEVFLFSDTIANNIAFGSQEISIDKVYKAAKDADLYNNVMDFPKQFETVLGERGITLSGGQKQRVSIARAIARDPKILILDDALSAVDTKTEHIILNSMKRIMRDRTSIIISHRVSSAKLANTIVVLDDGQIIEQGTHEELIAKNGSYKELYDKQLKAEEILEED
ncbi:MAG: ABC transporter ATP-binding protein [Cyclobacteriaceae bacterium]|nr:ABC transporter ATP-binding protein [Cyclobacteriaceae bacterium]